MTLEERFALHNQRLAEILVYNREFTKAEQRLAAAYIRPTRWRRFKSWLSDFWAKVW